MKKLITFIIAFAVAAQAAEFDIPYNQRRANGTNEAKLLSPGVSEIVMTNASRELITGPASGLGFLIASNNLSDLTNVNTALNNLGFTTISKNLIALTTPPAVRYIRLNADGSVTQIDAATLTSELGGPFESPLTFGTGLTRTVNTITVNTTQNIIRLSNLSTNGFVKTSSADGTLVVDTNNYLTGNQTITLSGNVTGSGSTAITTTIANNAVTGAMINLSGNDHGDIMFYDGANWVRLPAGTSGFFLKTQGLGADPTWATPPGGGDVTGPASATNEAVAIYDGTTGKVLKNGVIYSQSGSSLNTIAQRDGSANLDSNTFEAGSSTIFSRLTGTNLQFHESDGDQGNINKPTLSASRNWNLPDVDGTFLMDTTGAVVDAWVYFDGTTANNVTGTYSRTSPSTTLTVTVTNHGHIVGHRVYCDFTTGTGLDGTYEVVSVIDADNFTITTVASTTTSGNVTLLRRNIYDDVNVQSVVYQNSAGRYIVNFSSAMSDQFYAVFGTAGNTGMANPQAISFGGTVQVEQCVDILTANLTPTPANVDKISVMIIK